MKTYGERIVEIRESKGLSQRALADAIGMSTQHLYKHEKTKTPFTLKFRDKLLSFFSKKEVDYIEYGEDNSGSQTVSNSRGVVQQSGSGNSSGNITVGGSSVAGEPETGYQAQTSEGALVSVPYMSDVHGAMGEGGYVQSEQSTPMAFAPSFLRGTLGLDNFQGLHIINATGDSMEPTIKSGELIFVNPYENEDSLIKDGAIYVILCEGGVLVKRIRQNPIKRELTLISDNSDVDNIVMRSDEMDGCKIVGRVVGHFDKL